MGLKPDFKVVANSNDVTKSIKERFVRLRVSDQSGLSSDALEIKVDDDPNSPVIVPETGSELSVSLGYDGILQEMGMYIVDEVEIKGPPGQMVIRAKAMPKDSTPSGKTMMQTQKTRSFEKGTTLGGLVKTIASEHALTPAVTDSLSTIALPHIDQVNESDMNLLTRVARGYDAIAKPANGRLVLSMRAKSKTASGKSLPRISIRVDQVTKWAVKISESAPFKKVVATWRDTGAGMDRDVEVGEGEPVHRIKHLYSGQEDARSAARSEYDNRSRSGKKISLTLPGRPDLVAESPLTIIGVRPSVDGEWVATKVEHTIDSKGYQCSLSAERP